MTTPNLGRKERKGILVGMVLGDGSIVRRPRMARCQLAITHSTKQLEYLEYKRDLLESITGDKLKLHFRDVELGERTYRAASLVTRSDAAFNVLRRLIYPDGERKITRRALDYLTPHGIAIWWMDDGNHNQVFRKSGSLRQRQLTFCICRPEAECEAIQRYFSEVWGIEWGITRYHRNDALKMLRVGAREGAKFCDLIESYIIPSMRRKLLREYQAA